MPIKRSKTNTTYFEDIPQPNTVIPTFDFSKLQDIMKEKAYLNRLQELLQEKNKECIRVNELALILNAEVRRLKNKEMDQKNKIINLIPNKSL